MEKVNINTDLKGKLEEALAGKKEQTGSLVPALPQSCMIKTKHGKSLEVKFWIHTDKYFQYYEKGYELEDLGEQGFIIKGDTVIIPNHEIQYVIIRNAASSIPESMFTALGGKKKLIEVVGDNGGILQE